jgi:hypothetical protein
MEVCATVVEVMGGFALKILWGEMVCEDED